MNLPVAPAIPDTTSIAASSAANSATLGAKNALNGQTAGDTSGAAPASFDHVFAHVDDNGTSPSNTSAKIKAAAAGKAGKGNCVSTPSSGDAQNISPTTTPDVLGTLVMELPGTLAPRGASATSERDSALNLLSSSKPSQAKHGDHVAHKKSADSDANDAANQTATVSLTTPALTVEQMAAALASTASAPAIQNLNTAPKLPTDATSAADTLTLKGAQGRSLAEVLGQGTPVLNYQVATNASLSAASSASATAAAATVPAESLDSAGAIPTAASTDTALAANVGAALPGTLDQANARDNATSEIPLHHRAGLLANATQTPAANMTGTAAPSASSLSTPTSSAAPALAAGASIVLQNQSASPALPDAPAAGTATADASAQSAFAAATDTGSNSAAAKKSAPGAITASSETKSIAPSATRGTGLTGWQKPVGAAHAGEEKFADNGGRQNRSGDDSSNRSTKNTILATDSKQLTTMSLKIGTDTAIGRAPMTSNLHAPANVAPASDVFGTVSSSALSTTADTHAVAVSHASALVHQINEIGEGLWRVDRQSVEVNFNFGEKDRLSVRVEYKNGQVQATFNTNSTELRTAITQAWNSQNSSSGDRSYKMADPVFTSSSNSSFSSSEDASSNSRQFASFQDVTNFAGSSRSRSSASIVSAPASTSSRASLRPEVAGHLNAIV